MAEIKVSVIMPSLNMAPYIEQCLVSMREQTLRDIEILCVDAGSTDGTAEIIMRHAAEDARIRIIKSDKKSYGHQINLGISAARGRYIGIVETDDYADHRMYETLYDKAEKYSLDYLKAEYFRFADYHGRRLFDKNIRLPNGDYDRVIHPREEPHTLPYSNYFNIWSGLYRRDFLVENDIVCNDSPGASYQDAGFAIFCSLAAKRVMFIEDALYYYRKDNDFSSTKLQEKYVCSVEEFRWIKARMTELGYIDDVSLTLYMIYKYDTYWWNYVRLCPEYCRRFLEMIRDEPMDFCDESLLSYDIPNKYEMTALWQGDWSGLQRRDDGYNSYEDNTARIMDIIFSGSDLVVVSAGRWGERVVDLINKLEMSESCAVCDNSPDKQGETIEGLVVSDIESTVQRHPEAYYIVANMHHSQELTTQLEGLGIDKDRIYAIRCPVYWDGVSLDFLAKWAIPRTRDRG